MDFVTFCQSVQRSIKEYNFHSNGLPQQAKTTHFADELAKIINLINLSELEKYTHATILFEGFYKSLNSSLLKNELITIRNARWNAHFGVPTISFLLSYENEIETIKAFYIQAIMEKNLFFYEVKRENFELDDINQVLIAPSIIASVSFPQNEETGSFIKTHNPLGGFATVPCDLISKSFIDSSKYNRKVLEIGAAFGAATLKALKNEAIVFCNDIEPKNLAVVSRRYEEIAHGATYKPIENNEQLRLIPGEFPHELRGLPRKFFDAILISRVLHFFTGEMIEESLRLAKSLLAPKGRIYIVCETPYLKNWQKFIPEYNARVAHNVEWPGEITNPADFESSGRTASLPKFVHWISKEVLERSLLRAGFHIEHCEYIDRTGQFPDDLLLPEYRRESVGEIGIVEG